jgi:hypothetical protein
MGVLDALVETAAYVFGKKQNPVSFFIRATKHENKDEIIKNSIKTGTNSFYQNTNRFKSISNQPLCYWTDEKTIKLFQSSSDFESKSLGARKGLTSGDNFRYTRDHWENISQNFKPFISSDLSLRFFIDSNLTILWGIDGEILKNAIDSSGKQITEFRSDKYYFKEGISWSFRTSRFEPHLITSGQIFTTGRFLAIFKIKDDILSVISFWNSKYFDYILKLSMEIDTHPKFINGVVNQSPYPELSKELQKVLANETNLNHAMIEGVFNKEETSLYFKTPAINSNQSITQVIDYYQERLKENKAEHLASLNRINDWVYDFFGITVEEQVQIHEIVYNEDARSEGVVFDRGNKELIEGVFSWLLGCSFGRWDIRFAKHPEWLPIKEDIFSPLPFCSPGSLINTDCLPATKEKIGSDEWLAARKTLENTEVKVANPAITFKEYPIEVLWEGIAVEDKNHLQDIMQHIRGVIKEIWGSRAGEIEQELAELLGVRNLEDWLKNQNKFFNSHLNQYTQNKRIAPIYWPISTSSGSYTIWIYYPKLNDQTLYKIISDFIIPKKEEVEDEVKKLELNSSLDNNGKKQLQELQDLLHELQVMEKELTEVAELPYKPNHDDGVLITAAPLYRFFRHIKWRKSTEACWKALEKGDYDWAHLAYSIWPERVTKKCKKDLSMAIAHGLEDICVGKLKEKKAKKVAKPKKNASQAKLID